MTIDNGKRIVKVRLTEFIGTLIYVLLIFITWFPKIFRNMLTGKTITILTVAVTAIYLLFLLWPVIRQYRYIFFSADERTITLRWYRPGMIPGESRSIEIPVPAFAGYEIKKSAMGLRCHITLFQVVQGRRAAYQPVSISALSARERQAVESTLNNYKSTH